MSVDDTLIDAADDLRHDTETAYRASERYTTDAIGWIQDARDLPASLVMHIHECFAESAEFATRIDDILEGEITL